DRRGAVEVEDPLDREAGRAERRGERLPGVAALMPEDLVQRPEEARALRHEDDRPSPRLEGGADVEERGALVGNVLEDVEADDGVVRVPQRRRGARRARSD